MILAAGFFCVTWFERGVKLGYTDTTIEDRIMSTVEEIKAAIELLPPLEFARLRHWLQEKDWHEWDRQIEADSASGKLDFLIAAAMEEQAKRTLGDR